MTRRTRWTAALRQLVLQAPAPVVASMLGYHDKHTARLVSDAGGTWSCYGPRRPQLNHHQLPGERINQPTPLVCV